MNKVREESVGKSPQAQLQQTWNRFGPELPLQGFIPWDQKSLDQAWLSGRALTECAKKQPVTHAIEELLESVLSPTTTSASIPGKVLIRSLWLKQPVNPRKNHLVGGINFGNLPNSQR